jgi:hypothetical protein
MLRVLSLLRYRFLLSRQSDLLKLCN